MKLPYVLSLCAMLFATAGSANGQSTADTAVTTHEEQSDSVYVKVDKMAEFPGGMNGMMNFLSKNMRYPKEAMMNDIQGRVVVKFVINTDGSVSDAKIAHSVDSLLDAEALRIVNLMPNWTPGMNGGIPVRSYFNVPITFKLQEYTPKKDKKN